MVAKQISTTSDRSALAIFTLACKLLPILVINYRYNAGIQHLQPAIYQPATRRTHVIASGDTLWDLAERYGTTVQAIEGPNNNFAVAGNPQVLCTFIAFVHVTPHASMHIHEKLLGSHVAQ